MYRIVPDVTKVLPCEVGAGGRSAGKAAAARPGQNRPGR